MASEARLFRGEGSGRLFPGRRNAALAALAALLLVANPEPLMQLTAAKPAMASAI